MKDAAAAVAMCNLPPAAGAKWLDMLTEFKPVV